MPINYRKRFAFLFPLTRATADGRHLHVADLEIVGIRDEETHTIDQINFRGVNIIPLIDWMENQDQTPSSLYRSIIDAIENHLSTGDSMLEDFTMSMQ